MKPKYLLVCLVVTLTCSVSTLWADAPRQTIPLERIERADGYPHIQKPLTDAQLDERFELLQTHFPRIPREVLTPYGLLSSPCLRGCGVLNLFLNGEMETYNKTVATALDEVAQLYMITGFNGTHTGYTERKFPKDNLGLNDDRVLRTAITFPFQSHRGRPVLNTTMTVGINNAGLTTLDRTWYPNIVVPDTPVFTFDHVIARTKANVNRYTSFNGMNPINMYWAGTHAANEPTLVIYPEQTVEGIAFRLVWAGYIKGQLYIIDAMTDQPIYHP